MSSMREMQRAHAQQVHAQQRTQATAYRQHQQLAWEAEHARQAAERAAAEDERQRKRLFTEARLAKVAAANGNIRSRLEELDELLAQTLAVDDHIDLNRLKRSTTPPPFDPGKLATPLPPPQWQDFAPPAPAGLGKMFGGEARHQQQVTEAQQAFEQAKVQHEAAETQRRQLLVTAEERHHQQSEKLAAKVAAHNAAIDRFSAVFAAADPKAVVEYFGLVLGNSVYPDDFPQRYRLAYLPESRQLVVEYQLPTVGIIPRVQEYRYLPDDDEVTAVGRPATDIAERYADVITQITLRTVHELYEADRTRLIETVTLNGIVDTLDPGTGRRARPCLVSLRTNRAEFVGINLARVDPAACLRRLHARLSDHPVGLDPVTPVVDFDQVDKRFADEIDVLADLDQRPNLLTITADQFQQLIADLFTRLGLEMRQVRTTSDGTVECMAHDPRPLFGGKVVVLARRGGATVDVSAVRDLFGVVQAESASNGILVTTAGYASAAFDFASGKPLELIDGSALLHMLAESGGVKARIDNRS
ncbi:restriction endonuclease [Micromonospora sp. NBC_01813]|uniref:restriction endonuclease n=1 Tax=Micromonospora sp. NBC_01813 TaxID=2975988 RepID=UPI002DD9B725|nr:restriction endonuclease [Micromonospora sp. NBC_01813]WSA09406.1 restriction endonuclease [Micromonospora sp. NBC_01813]